MSKNSIKQAVLKPFASKVFSEELQPFADAFASLAEAMTVSLGPGAPGFAEAMGLLLDSRDAFLFAAAELRDKHREAKKRSGRKTAPRARS